MHVTPELDSHKIAAPRSLEPRLKRPKSLDSLCSLVHSLPLPVPRRTPAQRNPRVLLDQLLCSVANAPGAVRIPTPMLAAPAIDFTFDEDSDWLPPSNLRTRLNRTASVGNSWGVTSIGGGYSWSAKHGNHDSPAPAEEERLSLPSGSFIEPDSSNGTWTLGPQASNEAPISRSSTPGWPEAGWNGHRYAGAFASEPTQCSSPISRSPPRSSAVSLSTTPELSTLSLNGDGGTTRPPTSRSPSIPRPRRRNSQQRVSLVAGRLSMVSIDPPPEQSTLTPIPLKRFGSQSSFLSTVSSGEATPAGERDSFLGEKSISEYVIEGEIGRGAYGLVKRAREMNLDGSMGVCILTLLLLSILKIIHTLAPAHYQADYQVAHFGRLLEEAPEIWHNPNRDIRHVIDLLNLLCTAAKAPVGSCEITSRRNGLLG